MSTTMTAPPPGATRQIRLREAINEAFMQEMERDPSVIIIGEDIAGGAGREHLGIIDGWGGAFKTTTGLIKKFGSKRVRDTPLSEAAFVGAAIGAATTGLRPVAELMFVDFIGVCMDQVLSNASKIRYMNGGKVKVPFTLVARIGAGMRAGAHHSASFYSIFSHLPGLKVVAPCDPYTAKGLLISAIRDDDPVIYLEHKMLYPETGPVPEELYTIPLGKARIVKPGKDLTLVGISRMTLVSLQAAQSLEGQGMDVEVIDLMSVSPIDYPLILESVRKTHRLIVVDEDTPRCSVAADICSTVAEEAFDHLDAPPTKVTAPHTPVPYSNVLEDAYIPDEARVIATAKRLLSTV